MTFTKGCTGQSGQLPASLWDWSPRQLATGVVGVAAFIAFLLWLGSPSEADRALLRTVFRLPENVAFDRIEVNRKNRLVTPNTLEAIMRLPPEHLRPYVAAMNNKALWRPVALHFDETTFEGGYDPDALSWKTLSAQRPLTWGSLSSKQAQDARRGHYFCLAVQQSESGSFRGRSCHNADPRKVTGLFAQALLDLDTGKLHMVVRGVRGAH